MENRMGNRQLDYSWDDYRYFLSVARNGTLSAAATHLATEHTTISRHIRVLEEELKCTLFHKSNSGYQLTEAGERLLVTAEAIESAILSARAAATGEQEIISGTVRIAAPDGFGTVFLAQRLGKLTSLHPKLEVEIYSAPRQFSLSKREAEIVIGLSMPAQVRVISRRLIDYSLYIYASKAYLDQAPPIQSADDLKRHKFIGYAERLTFAPELNFLAEVDPSLEARCRSTNVVAQANATLGGAGLCVLPAYIAAYFPALLPVLPEQIAVKRSYHMHIHEDHRKTAHVRTVGSFIAAEVEQNATLFRAPTTRPETERA